MKGPSIAVMLAGKSKSDSDDSGGEPGLAEAKASALDAAKALMHATASRDAEGIYRAFRSLSTLCREIDDLEDSGESESEEEKSDLSEGEHEYGGLKEDEAGSDQE